jgi:5-methylcytosine-specific restriction endonuclease McrA
MPRAPKAPGHHVKQPWAGSTGHARTSTAAWQRLRDQILERDGRICYVCHKPGADTVDHINPVWKGGTDDPANLGAIHDKPCHRAKTAREAAEARWGRRR